MIRYRVKTFTVNGVPVGRLILERARVGLSTYYPQDLPGLVEQEVELVPDVFIFVWNRNVALGASFEIGGGKEEEVFYPHPLSKRTEDAAIKDVYRQGGGLTWSGRYKIISATLRRFIEGPKFQRWLREEASRLGLEVVE
jgi:hypothetical protein